MRVFPEPLSWTMTELCVFFVIRCRLSAAMVDPHATPIVRFETTSWSSTLAVGFWSSRDELRTKWQEGHRWEPRMPDTEREPLYRQWQKAIQRTLDWVDDDTVKVS